MNIHSVIYDAVFKDIHIMDSNNFIVIQWNCLLKCLDFYTNFDSFTVSLFVKFYKFFTFTLFPTFFSGIIWMI